MEVGSPHSAALFTSSHKETLAVKIIKETVCNAMSEDEIKKIKPSTKGKNKAGIDLEIDAPLTAHDIDHPHLKVDRLKVNKVLRVQILFNW